MAYNMIRVYRLKQQLTKERDPKTSENTIKRQPIVRQEIRGTPGIGNTTMDRNLLDPEST